MPTTQRVQAQRPLTSLWSRGHTQSPHNLYEEGGVLRLHTFGSGEASPVPPRTGQENRLEEQPAREPVCWAAGRGSTRPLMGPPDVGRCPVPSAEGTPQLPRFPHLMLGSWACPWSS